MPTIQSLHIYPIKSVRGIDLTIAQIAPEGLVGDRRWMVVDRAGKFLTQRTHPKLAQIIAEIKADGLLLHYGAETLFAPYPVARALRVTIWEDNATAYVCDDTVNAWLSACLSTDVQLVYNDPKAPRRHKVFAQDRDIPTSFADAYPVLLTTQASLDALNAYMHSQGRDPVTMARFRPNIVVRDSPAWDEDSWQVVKIGETVFDIIKPCTRCIMTTLDTVTGDSCGPAVMDALRALRRSGDPRVKGVLFGWNAVPRTAGHVQRGDTFEILERRTAPWPVLT